jgi:uncharacterized protein (TIGR02996 family)
MIANHRATAVKEEDWNRLLAEKPKDKTLRLVYADWLEETGQVVKAEGVRWYLAEKKRPSEGSDNTWCWWSHDAWPNTGWDPDDLPGSLFECLQGWDPSEHRFLLHFPSFLAAEQAVFEAYVIRRELGKE